MPSVRAGTFAAFRSRDFRLIWGGQTISFLGDAAFLVALGWRVTEMGGSLGYVLSVESLALLTTLLWGGVLADRHSRRLLMIGSDVARGLVLVGFLALDATGNLTTGSVLVLAALFGLADGFFHPAFGGIVPLIVDQPMLASANSWLNVARHSALIVGPAIAALLYHATGPEVVWGLDVLSFALSALALWLARPRTAAAQPREGAFRELAAGFRYVISVPWIWTGIAMATFVLMVAMTPFTALLPKLVRDEYDRGVGAYGALFSLSAVGMVAGSLLYARVNPRRHRVWICFGAFGLNDLGLLLIAVSPWFGLATVGAVWRGLFIGIGITSWMTMVTELVPESLLARVLSLDYFGSFALTPVGYALAGAAAAAIAPSAIIAFGAVVAMILWFVPLTSRQVRMAA